MKHLKRFLIIIFGLSLFGCARTNNTDDSPTGKTYKYTYDINQHNYGNFIMFSYNYLESENTEKKMEVFFETKYPDGVMVDVLASVVIKTQVGTLGTTLYDDVYPIHITNVDKYSQVLSYAGFKSFFSIEVKGISGRVMTNDDTVDLEIKASMKVKQDLEHMLEKFNQPYNTLYTESYIHIIKSDITTSSFVKNNFRSEPYYNETIYSDSSGILLMENNDGDIDVYSLSHYQTNKYIQKEFLIAKEDMDKVVEEPLYEFDNSLHYRIVNGDYVVSGPSDALLGMLFNDEETLKQWQNTIPDDMIEITIADLDTRLLISIGLWVGINIVKIETYYSFNAFNPIDLSTYIEMPAPNPVLADKSIQLGETYFGYIPPSAEYYYRMDVEHGFYRIETTSPTLIQLYDPFGNIVEPYAPMSSSIYTLEAGTYYIMVYTNRDYIVNYQIQFDKIELS